MMMRTFLKIEFHGDEPIDYCVDLLVLGDLKRPPYHKLVS